ncbi:hypothetical protein AB0G74_22265 [Streptomyces sp. NPDC020875]|uniref:hypothetical protein n=1 Tax=Streptomyces sp. NPDC020875 TaxID=3154898 RepID=UPI0034095E69
MKPTTNTRLQQIVEQCAIALTDADGRVSKRELTVAVREQLTSDDLDHHTKTAALGQLASSLVTGFGEQRNPRRRRADTLFHPRDLIKPGNGVWVWMDQATDSDLLAWSRLSRRNRARVDRADDEVQDYVDQRTDAFRTHTGIVRLIDLERAAFGWNDTDDEPEEPDQPGLFAA